MMGECGGLLGTSDAFAEPDTNVLYCIFYLGCYFNSGQMM